MKVAVVTPYYQESLPVLRRAHASVTAQTHPCRHIMVADGFGRDSVDRWPVEHIKLDEPHRDNGNTPRHLGAMAALEQDCDAVAFLDADNWYEPDHIAGLVDLHERTGAPVLSSRRRIVSLAGDTLLPAGEPRDGHGHNDTSTLMVTRAAFGLLGLWASMGPVFSPICDTVFFYAALFRGLQHAWHDRPTTVFQSHYKEHYYNALVEAPHDNSVENAFYAAYGTFIRASAEDMARVYLGLPADAPLPDAAALGRRFTAFGSELYLRDKSGDGLKYLERGTELCPDDPVGFTNLGAALARRNRFAEAETNLRRALDLHAGFAPAVHNLGLLRVVCGQVAEGLKLLADADARVDRASVRLGGGGYRVAGPPADLWT